MVLRLVPALCAGSLALGLLGACGKAPTPAAPPIPEVSVLKVEAGKTPLVMETIADIRAFREVEIRPRTTGLIEKQVFRPGQVVKEGEVLFVLDTSALDSALANTQAQLLEAETAWQRAQQDVARYKPLLEDDAVPRQTYDQAVAAERQALAIVQSRREGVNRARIDRSYAEVRAPLAGQVGLQKLEVGGLATAGQTVLATVSALEPMAAYMSIPEAEYLQFASKVERARQTGKAPDRGVKLVLADGSTFAQLGKFDFADRAINPQTGTLTLRVVFPNPQHLLRPGMTGRLHVTYDERDDALLVPQKAVTELLGRAFLSVVDAQGKVEQRPVKLGDRIGDRWLVEEGLKAGETIVVEGLQRAKAGSTVKPVPLAAAPAITPKGK